MSNLRVDELESLTTGRTVSVDDIDTDVRKDLTDPDKGAAMVAYEGGTVADKLDEIVSGAVTEPLVDTKVYTHNHDADAHPELRTRIISEVSSHVTAEADRAEAASDAAFVNADIKADFNEGVASTPVGGQFQVLSPNANEFIRYERTSTGAKEVGRYPASKNLARKNMTTGLLYGSQSDVAVDTTNKTITFSGGRVNAGSRTALIQETIIDYSALTPLRYMVCVDLDSGIPFLRSASATASMPETAVVMAMFERYNEIIYGLPRGYRLNGMGIDSSSFSIGVLYSASGTGISVDTTSGSITITGARLVADGGAIDLAGATLNYTPISNPFRFLVYSLISGLKLVVSNGIANLESSDILISSFNTNTGRLDWLPGGYLINGAPASVGGLADLPLNGAIALAVPDRLNFNFAERKIEISGNIPVIYGSRRYLVGPQVVDISDAPDSLWIVLVLDLTDGVVQHIASNISFDPALVVLGGFKTDEELVTGIENYSVNGRSASDTSAGRVPVTAMLAWDLELGFSAPNVPGYRDSDPIPLPSITTATIYSWYDALMADHPDYITRTLLGNEPGSDLPIYEYRFKPERPRITINSTQYPAPHTLRIYIQGGIHNERGSWVYPYELMRCIAEEWSTSPSLEALRFGVEISVVPALSPWGIDNFSYVNSNDVNINRNYPDGWVFSDAPGQGSGPSPLSEIETQCSYNHMLSFKPHVFIDCHDFGSGTQDRSAWYASPDPIYQSAAEATITRLAKKWRDENSWMPDTSDLALISTSGSGGLASRAGLALGIISGTHEFAQSIYQEPDAKRGSPVAIRCAVESLGNLLVTIVKKIT